MLLICKPPNFLPDCQFLFNLDLIPPYYLHLLTLFKFYYFSLFKIYLVDENFENLNFLLLGNFTIESELERERYVSRQKTQLVAIRDVLKKASNAAWRCDPKRHVPGKTYDEVTRLLQVSSVFLVVCL